MQIGVYKIRITRLAIVKFAKNFQMGMLARLRPLVVEMQ